MPLLRTLDQERASMNANIPSTLTSKTNSLILLNEAIGDDYISVNNI